MSTIPTARAALATMEEKVDAVHLRAAVAEMDRLHAVLVAIRDLLTDPDVEEEEASGRVCMLAGRALRQHKES